MRTQRKYGLFDVVEVNGRKRYVRLYPNLAFTKKTAVSMFQGALLQGALGNTDHPRCLRPVKEGQ